LLTYLIPLFLLRRQALNLFPLFEQNGKIKSVFLRHSQG
jgi:hypothetical protein